jgi:thiol-disulfide isomerase/thioredoxin
VKIRTIVGAAITIAGAVSWMGIAGGAGGILNMRSGVFDSSDRTEAVARFAPAGEFPSLMGATEWINTVPLSARGLRGKVVLVEFWTYTCINWRRESPYVRAWAERYKDKGLVVIGVHTPEFEFERSVDNVRWATQKLGINYPVAVDSQQAIWSAFGNEYWPALYFIDARGRIRGRHFGEGDYEESERTIRELLKEAGATDLGEGFARVSPGGAEVAADMDSLRSPESYVGYGHQRNFGSPGEIVPDVQRAYAAPRQMRLNHWALAGEWSVHRDSVVSTQAPARIAYLFHARDVNLVMGPSNSGASPRFRVLIDGKPPGEAHGTDVDAQGEGRLTEPRVYQLIRQPGEIADRLFEIEFLDPGAEAFDFTFG